MILLKATTESLTITTSTAATVDYSVSYADITSTTFLPSTNEGTIAAASTVTLLLAPAASTQRQVKLISITNHDVINTTVAIKKLISATNYALTPVATLLAGETMQYVDGQGWVYYASNGSVKGTTLNAAGGDKYIQFNDGGTALGADPGLTYDKVSDTLSLTTAASSIDIVGGTASPSAPPANTLSIFARSVAGRMMTAQIGPSGLMTSLQPILARNKIGYWCPPGNGTTIPGVFGLPALVGNGTATTRTVTTTNLANRMRRLGYPSTATAGTFAGARLATALFSAGSGVNDGSGFLMIERWVESDPAVVSGRRAFHGMTSNTAAFTNVEVSTLLNQIGIMQLSTDATQWYWIGSGSAAQTPTAIGTAIGAPGGNSSTAWELAIFAPNGTANSYNLQLTNITTGATISTTLTGAGTVVPQSTTLLSWNSWATNNATALAVGIDICSLYIETDN
jgi:hypothetical protein